MSTSAVRFVRKTYMTKDSKGEDNVANDRKRYYRYNKSAFQEFINEVKQNLYELNMKYAALSAEERGIARWFDDFLKRTIALDAFWNAQHRELKRELLAITRGDSDHVMGPLTAAIRAHDKSVM